MGFDTQFFAPTMADKSPYAQTLIVISTSFVALLSGFLLGVYSARGYLITPEFYRESRANYDDPVDSDETDVDEDELLMDHAPNWANGEEADRRQGLRATAAGAKKQGAKGAAAVKAVKKEEEDKEEQGPAVQDTGEECKLVLVVRTDLGMTKGEQAVLTRFLYPPTPPFTTPRTCMHTHMHTRTHIPHRQTAKTLTPPPPPTPKNRQDRSPVLPRHPGLLQGPQPRRAQGRPRQPAGAPPQPLGALRPGQGRRAGQDARRAARAPRPGPRARRHGRDHPGRRPHPDRRRQPHRAGRGARAQEHRGPRHGGAEVAVRSWSRIFLGGQGIGGGGGGMTRGARKWFLGDDWGCCQSGIGAWLLLVDICLLRAWKNQDPNGYIRVLVIIALRARRWGLSKKKPS